MSLKSANNEDRVTQSCQDHAKILRFTNTTPRSCWNLQKNFIWGLWTDIGTTTSDCHSVQSVPPLLITLLIIKLGDVKITRQLIKKPRSFCWSVPALTYDKVFFFVVALLPGEGVFGGDSLTKNKRGACCCFQGV